MDILITGVHGFVGGNLTPYLAKRNTIYGLDIVAPFADGVQDTFSWDDLDKGCVPEVDAIIHLAGKAHDTQNKSKADVYFQVNTELTKKIFDYFLKSKAKSFIFLSSVKAVADKVEGDYVDEETIPNPKGPYGESKIAAERYILSKVVNNVYNSCDSIEAHSLDDSNSIHMIEKKTYILRPCMIHGPGNKGNLNLLYKIVKKGLPWPLGAFDNKRSFTSIDNLCFIVEGLLSKDIESGIYNVNDDESVSTNELIEIICRVTGKRARVWRIPRGLMVCVAKIGGLLHLPLNQERLDKLTENYVSSNCKIKVALGVDMLPVRAKDGLTMTIKSF